MELKNDGDTEKDHRGDTSAGNEGNCQNDFPDGTESLASSKTGKSQIKSYITLG